MDDLVANCLQLCVQAAAHSHAAIARHSALTLTAMLASQLCSLLAKSDAIEQVDDLFAIFLQLCLQAIAHAHDARQSVLALAGLLASQP